MTGRDMVGVLGCFFVLFPILYPRDETDVELELSCPCLCLPWACLCLPLLALACLGFACLALSLLAIALRNAFENQSLTFLFSALSFSLFFLWVISTNSYYLCDIHDDACLPQALHQVLHTFHNQFVLFHQILICWLWKAIPKLFIKSFIHSIINLLFSIRSGSAGFGKPSPSSSSSPSYILRKLLLCLPCLALAWLGLLALPCLCLFIQEMLMELRYSLS